MKYELLSVVLSASVLGVLVMAVIIFFGQLRQELVETAKIRRLRYVKGGREVLAPRLAEGGFHLFLSHTWAQGQSDMRVVKQRLLEMMPDVKVFLDVRSWHCIPMQLFFGASADP